MVLSIFLLIVWVLVLLGLKKVKLHFFVFLVGSVGLFFFLMYFGLGIVEKWMEFGVAWCLGLMGRYTGLFVSYPAYSMISVFHRVDAVSFFVDYECSGFIETLVYVCLLAFYPVYGLMGKLFFSLVGMIYIFISNVLRVVMICSLIRIFGSSLFFFSHTVFARLIFFALMIVLYFFVFTRPHIIRQKVGNMTYGDR